MGDTKLKFNWKIEYEIPPLRAIYYCEAVHCTEDEARHMFSVQYKNARIRKITSFLQLPE